MTATTFDVHSFNGRTSDVATALLTALDINELEKREAAVAERETEVARREREIAATEQERFAELRVLSGGVLDGSALAAALGIDSTVATRSQPIRARLQDAFRVRESEWWTKVLGIVPTLP
jgi:hypothetical protein